MSGIDSVDERYKMYLPADFFCGIVFFELRKEHTKSKASLDAIIDGIKLRGFIGGAILRVEINPLTIGRIDLMRSETDIAEITSESLVGGMVFSKFIKISDHYYLGASILWSETNFSTFAFDIVALLNGTFETGRLSSFHGLGGTQINS